MPGGGLGEYDGCQGMFPRASRATQSRFGGLHRADDCAAAFAEDAGAVASCRWLFEGGLFTWPAEGVPYAADAIAVHASREPCPEALNRRSGCGATR